MAPRTAAIFWPAGRRWLTTGGLQDHVREVGESFGDGLRALAARHEVIRDVRGAGLMWGLDLAVDATPYINAALAHGLLVNRTATTVVRMLPPYVITSAEADEALRLLDGVFTDAAREGAS
jgi:acetylornithine/N-succinyldiaminopimelate aminotransferase